MSKVSFSEQKPIYAKPSVNPNVPTPKVVSGKPRKLNTVEKRCDYIVEALPNSYAYLGEGPHWDAETQSLYMVSIDRGKLLRYDYRENKTYTTKIHGERFASFVVPVEGEPNHFAVGCARRVLIVCWDGKEPVCCVTKVLFEVEQYDDKFRGNRFNDAKCDPRGRLFAGTMRYAGDVYAHRFGFLYRYDRGLVDVVKKDVCISNGLAWDPNREKFFFVDTGDFEVKEYDYNFNTGVISNPRVCWDLRRGANFKDHLQPDGMTIDTQGNIYVCTFNGSTIFKVNPRNGKVLKEIKLPTKQVTSCTFGGPNLNILFVTTAVKTDQLEPAGTAYRVTGLGAKGYAGVKVKIPE